MAMGGSGVKTLKVWSASKSIRKAVLASTFDEFVEKSKTKFGVEGEVNFVLNEDGTEVDEEYFMMLANNTVLLILKPGDRWVEASSMQWAVEDNKTTTAIQCGTPPTQPPTAIQSGTPPTQPPTAIQSGTPPTQPPDKVFFSASFSNHTTLHPGQILVMDQVHRNIGGLYHNDVGVFISDRDAVFLFSWSIYKMDGKHFSVHLMLDGDVKASSFSGITGCDSVSGSLALPLKKGNKVWLKCDHEQATVHLGHYAYFSAVSL